jgi:hypothetical protein
MPANQSRLPQTLMFCAEVIDDTRQIHARFQRLTHLGQHATTPDQAGQALRNVALSRSMKAVLMTPLPWLSAINLSMPLTFSDLSGAC